MHSRAQTGYRNHALIKPLQHRSKAMDRIVTPINPDLPVITPGRITLAVVMYRFDVVDIFTLAQIDIPKQPVMHHVFDRQVQFGIAEILSHHILLLLVLTVLTSS